MSRRLTTIAKWINENMPGFRARVERVFYNTDRHPKGVRWRIPGKGRRGNQLVVEKDGREVLKHCGVGTYRTNSEVERWVEEHRGGKTCTFNFCRTCRP